MRKLPVLGLLLLVGLLLLACQAPTAPVDTELSNVEATVEQPPTEAPMATTALTAAVAATAPSTGNGQGDTSQDDTATSSDPAAEEPDPLSVDPDRPGFTLDGSATLGAADAPVVIIDFSDFQ